MQNHAPHELIFIDETGIDMRHISRETGYAVKGKRPEVRREMTNNQRISVISAIGYDGYLSVCVLQPGETVTGDVFAEYLRNDIVPLLNQYTGRSSNSIVVLGNVLKLLRIFSGILLNHDGPRTFLSNDPRTSNYSHCSRHL